MKVRYLKRLENEAKVMTIGNVYEVIGIEYGSYRLIADNNEPYLFEPEQCEILDPSIPDFWIQETDEDGYLLAYPEPWFHSYFFEDFFDEIPGIVEAFWKDCEKYYGIKKNV